MTNEDPLNKNGIAGKPLQPTIRADVNAFKSFEASNAAPAPLPKPDIQESIQELHNDSALKNIRTYQSDIADALHTNEGSVVKIAVAQQKKEPVQIVEVDPKRSAALLILSILLMIGSGMAVTVYTIIHTFLKADQAVVSQKETVLISTETTKQITLGETETIPQALSRVGISGLKSDNTFLRFKFIVGTSTVADGKTVAEKLSSNIPEALVRTLEPIYSMGIQQQTNPVPYIILKTNSYESAFASMLAWEPMMWNDVDEAFSLFLASSSIQVPQTIFTDKIIKNKNVRVLLSTNNTPILMYAFPDRETIVITTHEETLKEIFTRLGTSQFVR